MNYLLDANTFIEAKNRYYGMEICPAYWDWILQSYDKNQICSIAIVKDELLCMADELSDWARRNDHFFIPESDEETQIAFQQVVAYVMSLTHMNAGSQEEFLRGADPWLIAKAMVTDSVIVTHEQFNQHIKKKILIPNVCLHFDIKCIDTFELLHTLEAKFILSVA